MEQEADDIAGGAALAEQDPPGAEDVLLDRQAQRLLQVHRTFHDRSGDQAGQDSSAYFDIDQQGLLVSVTRGRAREGQGRERVLGARMEQRIPKR